MPSKAVLYILTAVVIVLSLVGLIGSAMAASRATGTTAQSPAIIGAVSNTFGFLVGIGLVVMIWKYGGDSSSD